MIRRPRFASAQDYLHAHIDIQPNGCWHWTGVTSWGGYGQASYQSVRQGAHRLSYSTFVGPITAGNDIDHECHNTDRDCTAGVRCAHRRCVNPHHLASKTRAANIAASGRVGAARRETCHLGHAYDETNTYVDRRGRRGCRACRLAAVRRFRTLQQKETTSP